MGLVESPPGVSPVLEQIETKFRQLPRVYSGSNFSMMPTPTLSDNPRVQPEIQHGGRKTEVNPTSQAVYGTKYECQRLLPYC